MNSESVVKNFQAEIIRVTAEKLRRPLTAKEEGFVKAIGGFIALEMVLDIVEAEDADQVEYYLNSQEQAFRKL